MTEATITVLFSAAASVALIHTLIGVDHYLPFVVIGKARDWTLARTLRLTALCGVGHVLGSVILGLVGVGLGVAISKLEWIEGTRGSIAAWGLIAFGLVYAAYSAVKALRGREHSHVHAHQDGTLHDHDHSHAGEHLHAHEHAERAPMTNWTLFILFVFGPCEALIPMFMAPASEHNWAVVLGVALIFSVVTIATMLASVTVGFLGMQAFSMKGLQKYANTLAGLAIAGSGLAIQLLGI